ncbi:hypothetical protein CPTAKMECS_052 [Salmonella phage vB_SenS-AKM_ECS]|uniref:Uncharacterized protein n=1 Tax=Salmonella phage vB_SenS-AKM_HA2021_32 TaxID=3158841 RepID=A0AAU7L406_9CAUD|nr:hypothetical protein CPTAKMECS_052 [Salmonella phage vB_SenS-AKM_ECS]
MRYSEAAAQRESGSCHPTSVFEILLFED